MQLYAGRTTDQWRGFAAFDAGNSGEPVTRYDSARHRTAWRHKHRSNNAGYANAEHLGMRGEHDDESGNVRHDGTGQRHGRRDNAGRIAAGLLTEKKLRRASELPSRTIDRSGPVAARQKGGLRPPFLFLLFCPDQRAIATRRRKE
jgi:hypothetical protein